MVNRFTSLLASAAFALAAPTGAMAQTADTIVVFDGSGSMWGQINGKTKIEIARETLSTVLTEIPGQNRIGMIAYGHREKGVCSDIETVVPVGPAGQSVPRMVDFANRLTPKGKTPLTDAVRVAADELKFTENAATVVLVTDGIETCDADPCALGRELEAAGINFTAHVVGFGLSQEEGRQVQCLADNTGGLYLSANNADELGSALRRTVQAEPIAPSEDDFGPAITTRNVRFVFRDSEGGETIGIRQLRGFVEKADGMPVEPDAFQFAYPEASGNSATAKLEPGSYVAVLRRDGDRGAGYDVRYPFDIPEGDGDFVIEAALSGSLTLNVFINPNLRYEKGDPFPSAVGRSRPRLNFAVFPVENAQKAAEPIATFSEVNGFTLPLGPGTYLVQGNIDSGTSAEQLVQVQAGTPTVVDFSFDATRVYVDAREASGVPVKRQTTHWYDKMRSGRNYWVSAGGAKDGGLTPFYLPTGKWKLNVGGEGYGKRRSERIVTIPGDFQDMRIQVGEGEVLSQADMDFLNERGDGCVEILKVKYSGCLVEKADLTGDLPPSDDPAPAPDGAATDLLTNLKGMAGEAHVFVDGDHIPKLSVVFAPGDTDTATVVLSDGWCGLPQCGPDRFSIDYDEVDLLLEDGFAAKTAGVNSYQLAISTFGQDKEIAVSGAGASRVRLSFFDRITLDGNGPGPAPSPVPEPASLTDKVNRVFGVFVFDQSGASVETVVSDFQHTNQCQRSPVVIYPDNSIAFKQFEPPQSATDNPFKTIASGNCSVSGSRFDCAVRNAATGATETMSFVSELLGNNHYSLTMAGDAQPTLAASCFFPGGSMQAGQVMPNGRELAELIIERANGAPAGMGYDRNNNIFEGN